MQYVVETMLLLAMSSVCTFEQVYGNNDKSDIANQADLQAAFDDIFFQYQVDMTW